MREGWALVALLAAMAGAGVVLWRLRSRTRPGAGSTGEKGAGVAERPVTPVRVAPGTEEEFEERVERFEGLFESLHRAGDAGDAGRCRWVLGSWEARMKSTGADALLLTWQTLLRETTDHTELGDGEATDDGAVVEVGKRWLALLREWGMDRDERRYFEPSEAEEDRYFLDREPEEGEVIEVDVPCWTYGDEVIERGIARAVAAPT